jgi:hypothetical protein
MTNMGNTPVLPNPIITADTLRNFAPQISDAPTHAAALEAARLNSSVNTAQRLCHFMGQIYVESAGLTCEELTSIALKLRERIDLGPQQRYRLVGVGLSNFRESEERLTQPILFE